MARCISQASGSRRRFGFILTAELPTRVEEILARDDRVRWRFEGFAGSLGSCSVPSFDENLAAMLSRRGCEPEEIASALYQRPRDGRVRLSYCMDIAEQTVGHGQ